MILGNKSGDLTDEAMVVPEDDEILEVEKEPTFVVKKTNTVFSPGIGSIID